MGTLNVHFRGACTHFIGVVPGVPHRVVLTDCRPIRFGMITMPATEGVLITQPYVLCPHLPFLVTFDDQQTALAVPHAIADGYLFPGVRVEVPNATGDGLHYEDTFHGDIPSLRDFVRTYEYSDSVVLGGTAACYFDLSSGWVSPEVAGKSYHAVVRIDTRDEPILRVTPFVPQDFDDVTRSTEITLRSGTNLYVANWGADCPDKEGGLDFLVHYLTADGGIPQVVTRPPFGYSGPSSPIDEHAHGERLEKLLRSGFPLEAAPPDNKDRLDTATSCSDSRYP